MAAFMVTLLCAALGSLRPVWAQTEVQCNTFNSTAKLTAAQIKRSELNKSTADAIAIALNFERSNWAGDSVRLQDFYTVPPNTSHLAPGSLIKKEDNTSTLLYTVPPNVALSRFVFQSETLNGTSVPASAYVLWPHTARRFKHVKGVPVVAWGHGNSGWNAECAPTHIRNLWYQFSAPFELALSGYAVVAPDYTGLGVGKDGDGKPIFAQWLAGPAGGNDLMNAVLAAREGWPELLSKKFVVMGHSQGGGAAWGAAQRQAERPIDGYLGTVSGSPVTSILALSKYVPGIASVGAPGFAHYLKTVFPSFKPSDILTELGIKRLGLHSKLQGCNSVSGELLLGKTYKTGWLHSWYVRALDKLTTIGGKQYQGPLLILQGDADPVVGEPITTEAVKKTCAKVHGQSLHYARFAGVSHVPVLYASRAMWMDWIADRFSGVEVADGCRRETVEPLRDVGSYQKEIGYTLQWSKYPYENA